MLMKILISNVHKLSEYSPAIAAGDVDGNGFDDIIVPVIHLMFPTLFLPTIKWKNCTETIYAES